MINYHELCFKMFQAILMSPNLTHPSEMNLFVSKILNNEKVSEIVTSVLYGSVTKTSLAETFSDFVVESSEKYLLELQTEKVGLKFWIGFSDVKSAELFRHDFTTTTTTMTK